MSRTTIIALAVVVILIVAMIALAGINTEVPTHPIQAPVSLPTNGNNAAPQP
jgi:hypothetical protein